MIRTRISHSLALTHLFCRGATLSGYLLFSRTGGCGLITKLAVGAAFRRRGIGSALLRRGIAELERPHSEDIPRQPLPRSHRRRQGCRHQSLFLPPGQPNVHLLPCMAENHRTARAAGPSLLLQARATSCAHVMSAT